MRARAGTAGRAPSTRPRVRSPGRRGCRRRSSQPSCCRASRRRPRPRSSCRRSSRHRAWPGRGTVRPWPAPAGSAAEPGTATACNKPRREIGKPMLAPDARASKRRRCYRPWREDGLNQKGRMGRWVYIRRHCGPQGGPSLRQVMGRPLSACGRAGTLNNFSRFTLSHFGQRHRVVAVHEFLEHMITLLTFILVQWHVRSPSRHLRRRRKISLARMRIWFSRSVRLLLPWRATFSRTASNSASNCESGTGRGGGAPRPRGRPRRPTRARPGRPAGSPAPPRSPPPDTGRPQVRHPPLQLVVQVSERRPAEVGGEGDVPAEARPEHPQHVGQDVDGDQEHDGYRKEEHEVDDAGRVVQGEEQEDGRRRPRRPDGGRTLAVEHVHSRRTPRWRRRRPRGKTPRTRGGRRCPRPRTRPTR